MGCARSIGKAEILTPAGLEALFGRPITTRPYVVDGGQAWWWCGDGVVPCVHCGHVSDYACDWATGDGKTCDLAVCEDHAFYQQGLTADIDYCPQHDALARGVAAGVPRAALPADGEG